MRIVVFSGTTEGRDFSRAAAALGIAVTVSVATDLGAEEQGQAPGITVHSGRLLPGAKVNIRTDGGKSGQRGTCNPLFDGHSVKNQEKKGVVRVRLHRWR